MLTCSGWSRERLAPALAEVGVRVVQAKDYLGLDLGKHKHGGEGGAVLFGAKGWAPYRPGRGRLYARGRGNNAKVQSGIP